MPDDGGEALRLNRAVSSMASMSRRGADRAVREGRITVNGRVVIDPASPVDISKDHIKLDGKLLRRVEKPMYIALYKPPGFVVSEEEGGTISTAASLLKGIRGRAFAVGRLDVNSEGLLLFTNDGEMAYRLMRPEFAVPRIYRVKVRGVPGPKEMKRLEDGITITVGKGSVVVRGECRIERVLKKNAWINVKIREGKTREIRRMMERIGHPVLKLIRVSYGCISLGKLKKGEFRHLTWEEVQGLKVSTGMLKRMRGKGGKRPPLIL